MANRYRTGNKLNNGTIVVRGAQTRVLPNGSTEILDRGLRIKYRNHSIDLDRMAEKYNWSEDDLAQAVAKMDELVAKTPRGKGRGYYRDNPVSSIQASAAEQNQQVHCAAFWTNPDGSTGVCGEIATEDTVPPTCAKHAPKKQEVVPEGAAVPEVKKKAKAS